MPPSIGQYRGQYRLTPLARADLEEIWRYTLKNWSMAQADHYHHELVTAFVGLADGSKLGKPVDIRDGYWKYIVGTHVIFYRPSRGGIDIIRILHQRMDVNKQFSR